MDRDHLVKETRSHAQLLKANIKPSAVQTHGHLSFSANTTHLDKEKGYIF